MVSSSCSAATACHTLPILVCWLCSFQSLLNFKLPFLGAFAWANAEPAEESATTRPGSWPAMSTDFAKPSMGLFLWCCFPILGYAMIQGLSDCEQYTDFCWQVEVQTTSSHLRNLLHLLAMGIILAWLCNVPPRTLRYGGFFAAAAVCEFLLNKLFWKNCEDFMAHSLSADSTFGLFDIFLASATMLTLIIHTCEGLPSLRRCFQRLSQKMGISSGDQNPELFLSLSGQRNYLIYLCLLVFFHGGLFFAFPETVHAHHYWVGFVVASCCIFWSPLSRLLLLKSATGQQ